MQAFRIFFRVGPKRKGLARGMRKGGYMIHAHVPYSLEHRVSPGPGTIISLLRKDYNLHTHVWLQRIFETVEYIGKMEEYV